MLFQIILILTHSLNLWSLGFDANTEITGFAINMTCQCHIYNESGVDVSDSIGFGTANPYFNDITNPVSASVAYVGVFEALLCEGNLAGDLSQSCPSVYMRVQGACREMAQAHFDYEWFPHTSLSKCTQAVVSF